MIIFAYRKMFYLKLTIVIVMQLFVSFTYLHLTKSYILQEYYAKQRCSLIPVDFPKKNLNTSKTRRKAEDTGILQK